MTAWEWRLHELLSVGLETLKQLLDHLRHRRRQIILLQRIFLQIKDPQDITGAGAHDQNKGQQSRGTC
jgi:hypothetical protein